jgi:type I restriction enzyme S subunit
MTELKNIPNGWVETTLNAVAEIKYGKDHKHLKDGDIPCLGSGGLMRFVDEILYDKPSVLIPRKGTISNLFFIDEPFWTVDTLFYTKINENKIIPKYLYFKLKTINLENMDVGSAVPSLTTAVLNQIEIVIPKDIEEQKSIAYILTAFDDKIELLQSQNKTLEEMAQTIFVEWFGKYSIEDELPDGWRVGKLGDFNAVIADFVANGSFASLKENVTLYDYEEYALFMRNTD